MPSTILIQVANDFHRRHVLGREGIYGGDGLKIERAAMLSYLRSLRDDFVGGVLASVEKIGERNLRGYARFREPTVLDVEGEIIVAKRMVIATGSSPFVPKPWQESADRIITRDSLFEQQDLPDSLAVIGLGVIGVELGQALARIGVNVTGFDQLDQVAGVSDPASSWRGAKAPPSATSAKIRKVKAQAKVELNLNLNRHLFVSHRSARPEPECANGAPPFPPRCRAPNGSRPIGREST